MQGVFIILHSPFSLLTVIPTERSERRDLSKKYPNVVGIPQNLKSLSIKKAGSFILPARVHQVKSADAVAVRG
jgi:hypothetical protein